jgi:hypothetical protein
MNSFLDIIGGLLYLVFRICTIPGIVILYSFFALFTIIKYTGQLEKKLYKQLVSYLHGLHQPAKRSLQLLPRWVRFQ